MHRKSCFCFVSQERVTYNLGFTPKYCNKLRKLYIGNNDVLIVLLLNLCDNLSIRYQRFFSTELLTLLVKVSSHKHQLTCQFRRKPFYV